MCGIAGIIYKDGRQASAHSDLMKGMLASIAHRGPDDEGTFYRGGVALGHRRLSILDISEAGHQPMFYKDYVIVYNGEVYNYLELREELKSLGHEFNTGTDTEVILHSYEEWGEDCLQRFNGMWAFALYDAAAKRIFCSRDRFGVKPFYYYEDEEKFLFASEIKALLAAGVEAKVNFHILLTYLVVGFTNFCEETFFLGVYQLLPGRQQCLDLVGNKVSINRYYNLAKQYRQGMTGQSFMACLKNSVKLHLRSDVPIGTCLSGGLDSSVVAALASSLLKETVGDRAFGAVTAVSESRENDESSYAKKVVEHCGLEWHPVKPTYKDFVDHVEDCLLAQGEPVGGPSLFMQYWVMKKAKEEGLKVMLDGQGGDETLLGYERYYPGYFWDLLKRGKIWRMMSEYVMAARNSKLSLVTLSLYTMYFLILPVRRYILRKRASFLKEYFMKSVFEILRGPARAFFRIRDLQDLDIGVFQLPNLLLYEDRNSMAHSIEARVPFVELNCIETGVSLRPEEKICNGFTKYPLRLLAEKILPKLIAWRTNKIGFEAPTQLWLSQYEDHMQKMVDESLLLAKICLNIPRLNKTNLEMRWKLYNISVWEKQCNVSVS